MAPLLKIPLDALDNPAWTRNRAGQHGAGEFPPPKMTATPTQDP